MVDTVERLQRERTLPTIEQLKWKSLFLKFGNPNSYRRRHFVYGVDKKGSGLHILRGTSRVNDSVVVEYDREGMAVVVDVNEKRLLKVNDVDLSRVKHDEIVDLNADGDRWEGDVLDGKPWGLGVLYDRNNSIAYVGFRIDRLNVCYGREFYSHIGVIAYEGEWCEGLRWGRGVQYDRNGDVVYDGEWVNDVRATERIGSVSGDVAVHNRIEELVVNNYCGGEDVRELDLCGFVNLRELKVGKRCFKHVDRVSICELRALERIYVERNSFTTESDESFSWGCSQKRRGGRFYLKDCPKLQVLSVDLYAFSDFDVCEIERVRGLRVIGMGGGNFMHASLELVSTHTPRESGVDMPSLETLVFGAGAFENCSRAVFEGDFFSCA